MSLIVCRRIDDMRRFWRPGNSCPLKSEHAPLAPVKGWSQQEFAHEAGLHRTYVSDLERGARNPTITVVDKLAVAVEVKVGELLDETRETSA